MLSGGRLDARTSLYKVLREKEQELTAALGGDPSLQERIITLMPQDYALRRHTRSILAEARRQHCAR